MRRRAFTLIEVIVVIGLVGLLMSLILPAVQSARSASMRLSCQNQMRQLALAVLNYEQTNGVFPVPNRLKHFRPQHPDAAGPYPRALSWLTFTLPYVEQSDVYATAMRDYQTEPNPMRIPPHTGLATVIRQYICPEDARLIIPQVHFSGTPAAFTSYLGVGGNLPYERPENPYNGVLMDGNYTVRMADITDGASATLMLGERPPNDRFWGGLYYTHYSTGQILVQFPDTTLKIEEVAPIRPVPCRPSSGSHKGFIAYGPGRLENACDLYHFWSLHGGGGNFAFSDGSVRFILYSVSLDVMHALASRNGNEAVEVP